MKKLIIATRGSRLARAQTGLAEDLLRAAGVCTEQKIISTRGDMDAHSPLKNIGGDGLFVREMERELAAGGADIAVHSAKDLPADILPGLVVCGVLPAGDPRDCLVLRKDIQNIEDMHVIGTGSPRRVWQCGRLFPNAVCRDIRGNVDTRLKKLKDGLYDGIVLAHAGLLRLGADMSDFHVHVFDTDSFIPAACQGILALECRADDEEIKKLAADISDRAAWKRFLAERSIFRALGADCSAAAAVHVEVRGEEMEISAMHNGKLFRGSCGCEELWSYMEKIKQELS